jgi:hypothetical protein
MSNKMIAITVGIIILLLFLMMSGKRNNMLEHLTETPTTSLTDIDVEALQNLSSMYNSETETVSLNNATIAGDLTVAGKTSSKYYTFPGNYTPSTTDNTIYQADNYLHVYGKNGTSIGNLTGHLTHNGSTDRTTAGEFFANKYLIGKTTTTGADAIAKLSSAGANGIIYNSSTGNGIAFRTNKKYNHFIGTDENTDNSYVSIYQNHADYTVGGQGSV